MSSEDGIAVVRRNTEEVQGQGNFEVFEELFASDFVDHTPSRAASPRTVTALGICTVPFAPRFLTFMPRSIGRFLTATV